MLEKEEDIPKGAKRPVRDLGHRYALCQGISMSRKEGISLAMVKDDHWCFEPVIGYGLAEAPQYFLDGHNRYPGSARTLQAGSTWAHELPRLETGKYIGMVFAPLKTANFEPGLVMIFCDSAQMAQILIVVNWIDGHDLMCQLSGHAGCVYAGVPTIRDGKYHVTIPCMGVRMFAAGQDDELVFTMPKETIEDFMAGLRYIDESSYYRALPVKPLMMPDYHLGGAYAKIGRIIGMEMYK